MNHLLECALAMAAGGFAVFPLLALGKKPLTEHGFLDAVKDSAAIRRWWQATPRANVGIATGKASGIWVLDADEDRSKDKHGLADLQRLVECNGPLPATRTAITPRGGMHFYFAYDAKRPVNNSVSKLAFGLDTRGDGGYVCAPDSERADGAYLWASDGPVTTAPPWLMGLLTQPPKPAHPIRPIQLTGSNIDRALACLARLSPARADNYQQWVEVGMSLYGLGFAGLQLWDDWSSRSHKYHAGECERKWKSFELSGIGLGSLVRWAELDSPMAFSRRTRRQTWDYADIIANG